MSDEKEFYQAMEVPPPVEEPEEILQRLMAFRNEWKLYHRKCDFSGEPIISAYAEEAPFPVYKNEIWWGDSWEALDYGVDFDFSRPFFEQYAELQKRVPREGTSVFSSENCAYNSHIRESKNCYMNSLVYRCENTHFSYWAVNNYDVVDCLMVNNSTLAYDSIDCDNIYDCVMLQECRNCQDCHFSYQLQGCSNCIGCSNLVNKSYYLYNQPTSKEEFLREKNRLINGSFNSLAAGKIIFQKILSQAKHRALHNFKVENVVGNHIDNSRNCYMSFDGNGSEDVYYSTSFADSKDIYHCYSAGWPACELIYNSAVTRGSTNIAFCYYTYFSSNLRYCDSLSNSEDCFGCIGLKRKQYCILNKQYSAEEYHVLRSKIINHMKKTGEWGKFFPTELSTFAYNETCAQDFFPISREEAVRHGWRWRATGDLSKISAPTIPAPDSLDSDSDDIIKQALSCVETGKAYRICSPELRFYRKMNLPLPHCCPEARHRQRSRRRDPNVIHQRKCSVTERDIYSCYSFDSDIQILSEEAYLESLL